MASTTPATSAPAGLKELIHTVPAVEPHPTLSTEKTPLLTDADSAPVYYLAYGSNLSYKTFTTRRGITPLASTPVIVPSLYLTYNLAGLPYVEPSVANVSYTAPTPRPCVHGIVYTITTRDFARIVATEGGGASYTVIDVPCHPYDGTEVVNAKTLYVPPGNSSVRMPEPEPSKRYLGLLIMGAGEHKLDDEYRGWLEGTGVYTVTTWRQKVGRVCWIAWGMPVFVGLMMMGVGLADKEGRIPAWLVSAQRRMFTVTWWVYDNVSKKVFGDGERTER